MQQQYPPVIYSNNNNNNNNILTIYSFYKDYYIPSQNDLFNNPPNQCPICFNDIDSDNDNDTTEQFYIINNQLCECYKNVIICQSCLFHYLLINKCFICNKYIYPCFTNIHNYIKFQDIQIYYKFSNYRIKKIKNYLKNYKYPQQQQQQQQQQPTPPRDSASIYIPPPPYHRIRPTPTLTRIPYNYQQSTEQSYTIVSIGGYPVYPPNRCCECLAVCCGIFCTDKIIRFCAIIPFLLLFGLMISSFFIVARRNY